MDNKDKFHLEALEEFYSKHTSDPVEWNKIKSKETLEQLMTLIKCKTGGFRAVMKEGLNGINEITINILFTQLARNNETFVVGFDHRNQSEEFALTGSRVLKFLGKSIKLLKHVVTPYLAYESNFYDIGIMITASHNTKEYNGIKLYKKGSQMHDCEIQSINNDIHEKISASMQSRDYSSFYTSISLYKNIEVGLSITQYYSYFKELNLDFKKDINGYNFIFCGLHGVSTIFIEQARQYFNIKIDIGSSLNPIDPEFGRISHPNPEVSDNWNILYADKPISSGNIYFMCDGDGDRFGVSLFYGNYQRLNPNLVARIFFWYFYKNFDAKDLILVNTFLCDDFFQKIHDTLNIRYKKTKTGAKYLAEAINALRNDSLNKVIAYEDPMGYILGGMREKDGIYCTLLMCKILREYNISAIIKELETSYGEFYSFSYHYKIENPEDIIDNLVEKIKKNNTHKESNYFSIIHDAYLINEKEFKVFLRLSGTESIVKIYSFSNLINADDLKVKTIDWINLYFE